jgi:hypothetical protein
MTQTNDEQLLSNVFDVGVERLKLIGKHAQVLMQGYLSGGIEASALSEQALKKLINARVIYQPDDSYELKLRHPVTQLIAAMVTDESRRQVNADIADKLQSIRGFVQGFREAQRSGDVIRADNQLQRTEEAVYDLTSQFEEAIFSLWHRLNSNFGFVSNLSDKIRENSRAQQQIRRLIEGLSLIDFDELIELAEGNPTLRKLLVTKLQAQINGHHGSLLEVQKRLVELMTRFREQQERSLLVTRMAGFLREHPGFTVGDYAYRSRVPTLINQATAIIPAAAVALDRRDQHADIASMVHGLYKELAIRAKTNDADSNTQAVDNREQQQAVEARQQQLKRDAMQYFIAVCDSETPLSALDYLYQQSLEWPAEAWLFQVIGEYNSLPRHEQKLFNIERSEQPLSRYNQVIVIEDITLSFNT